jgi:putative ABC transport system permease protein
MLRNYLTVAIRSLRRHPLQSAINLVGLALGLAVCVLLAQYLKHEWSYDRFHEKNDRISRVLYVTQQDEGKEQVSAQTPIPLAGVLQKTVPGIRRTVRLMKEPAVVRRGEDLFDTRVTVVDSTFFDVFTFPLARGHPETALAKPEGAVLSAEAARRYFGTTEIVGRSLSVRLGEQFYDVTVTGVAAPLPANSSIQFDVLLPMARAGSFNRLYANPNWGTLHPTLYVERAPGVSNEALQSTLASVVSKELSTRSTADALRLQPFTSVRYAPTVQGEQWVPTRNPNYLYVLGGIAGFILLIACINFTTLSVARSTDRAQEVGVRKTVGALREQLMAQFWSEAFLLCTAALGLGLALAALIHPLFQWLVSVPLPPIEWTDPVLVGLLGGLLLVVGLLSGSYPSAYLSRFRPHAVLRRTEGLGRPPRLVQGLVVVQFALAIGLVVGTLVMVQQIDLLRSKSLGYESEQVVRLSVPFREGAERWQRLRTALADETRVQHVAGSWNQLGEGDGVSFQKKAVALGGRSIGPGDDGDFEALTFRATPNIVETLGLEVVTGQSFAGVEAQMGENVVLVNRAFVEAAGWDQPVGRRVSVLFGASNARVVGVASNFHARSLHHEIQPLVMTLDAPLSTLYARLAPGSLTDGMDVLRRTWTETMPDLPFQYTFLNDAVEQQYSAEQRWARTIRYGAGFALFIACLGLLGLAQLAARRRTQEIGLRKVLGASSASIVGLLARDFLTRVAMAFVVAVPLSYWAAQRWLQDFAYRIDLRPWIFLGAGALVATVAFLTVGAQAWRVARIDPATTLRDK